MSLPSHLHQRSSLPRSFPTATRHAIFASVIPLFMSFIQLKYLNKCLINPYDTHPITIYASTSTLLLYFISSVVEARLNHSVDNIYVLVCGHICDLNCNCSDVASIYSFSYSTWMVHLYCFGGRFASCFSLFTSLVGTTVL